MPSRRTALLTALKVFDLAAVLACYAAAAVAVSPERRRMTIEEILALRVRLANVVLFAGFLLAWHLVFEVAGVYRSKRLTSVPRHVAGLVQATAAGSVTVALLSLVSGVALARGAFLPLFFAAITAVTVASRLALRWMLGLVRRRGRNLRNALVIGTNARALAFARRLEEEAELGYRLVGFLESRIWDGSGAFERAGWRLVGGVDDLAVVLRRQVVDEVMVFLPVRSCYERVSRIVAQCEEQGIPVTLSSTPFAAGRRRADDAREAEPVVTLATGPMDGVSGVAKRLFDVVVASAALAVLAPVMLGVAAAVRLSSPGPVLFAQERVGLNKRRFRMLKFRTMVHDAESRLGEVAHLNEASGPVFKVRRDPRVTRVGSVLRRTSLDELPQLLNVVRGDLSLVGPRPLPLRDYEGFAQDRHRRRFCVRPGITCLWQIGGRSDVSFERWMELDMQYIDTWSLWLDVKILLKTIPAVIRGTGAV